MEEQRAPVHPPNPPEDSEDQSREIETTAEMPEKHLSINCCDLCIGDNLIKQVGIVNCSRCYHPFCIHFASKIDPAYCVDCMAEVALTREVVTKTYEHYDEVKDVTTSYSRRARHIKIEGQDWLFSQRKLYSLTDAELDMAAEYHRQLANLIMVEQEERRNQKLHRYAGVKVVLPTPSTTTTKVTTTKTVKTTSTKKQAQISSLVEALMAKGMTAEGLAALLKK